MSDPTSNGEHGRVFVPAAVILAAGASTRMGRPKMLLPWGKTSVIGHLISQWKKLEMRQVAVVCAARDAGLKAELKRLRFPLSEAIPNTAPARGMFSSIQCAARWTGWKPGITHWVMVLGDQPHLRVETLRRVIRLAKSWSELNAVIQPSRKAHGRHPVFLPATLFAKIATAREPNLKLFLEKHAKTVAMTESSDEGLDLDIDSPADYKRALALAFKKKKKRGGGTKA